MANIYVRSTDGSDADNGSTWALAKATLAGAEAIAVAGDTIYVADGHSENTAAVGLTINVGTHANPLRIICVDDTGDPVPPTAAAVGASVVVTGANLIFGPAAGYVYGITFTCGTSTEGSDIQFVAGSNRWRLEKCQLINGGNNAGADFVLSNNSSSERGTHEWFDVDIKTSNAGSSLEMGNCNLHWRGGSILSGSATPTGPLLNGIIGFTALIEGVDFSNFGTGLVFVTPGPDVTHVVIRNCKLPSGWTGYPSNTPTEDNARVEMFNCDSGDTNYRLWIQEYAGTIRDETIIVRTGGASDGTTTLSWKMEANSNAEFPFLVVTSPEIVIWNDITGSSKTVTVEVVTDNVTLTDKECWLEVEYLGTSGAPLADFVSDSAVDPVTAAANQASSSATWTTTGLTTPVKQKLSVTFTPQEKGFFIARVLLAKPSTTVYVCPKLEVS